MAGPFAAVMVLLFGWTWSGCTVAQAAASEPVADEVLINVLGAVARPGPARLPGSQATAAYAFAALGGARVDAYRFATLLLRTVAEAPPRFPCVSPGARHAALLIGDDPVLRGEAAILAGLLDGRIERMAVHDRPFGRLGSDRGETAMLRSGDVLALPRRSAHVFVVLNDGRVETIAHGAEWMADDYLDAVSADRLAPRRAYVLHYPDGTLAELKLEGWNAEPAAVPPGSMLAPSAACLPVPD